MRKKIHTEWRLEGGQPRNEIGVYRYMVDHIVE